LVAVTLKEAVPVVTQVEVLTGCEEIEGLTVVMVTLSFVLPHLPLFIVHCNTGGVPPKTNPVTVEVGEFGEVIVAVPETTFHVPVNPADIGVFPAKFAVVAHKAKV
jgi:hypothetical protein